jgi:uncharacterized protein YdbL (DUF1318 family)
MPRKWFAVLASLVVIAGLSATPAEAQSLDQLRASGVVGERFDGYAQALGGASGQVRALVSQVNAKRRRLYQQRAAEQRVSAGQVGRVFAGQIMQRAPRGTPFLSESGRWTRK